MRIFAVAFEFKVVAAFAVSCQSIMISYCLYLFLGQAAFTLAKFGTSFRIYLLPPQMNSPLWRRSHRR